MVGAGCYMQATGGSVHGMSALLPGWPAAGRSSSAVDAGLGVGMCWTRAVGLP